MGRILFIVEGLYKPKISGIKHSKSILMKIIITEEQYERLSGEMGEALGVPEGILEAGEEIYDLIVKELEDFEGDVEELVNDGLEFEHKFKIKDHYFYRVRVKFDIEEHPAVKTADLLGMSSENESELSDDIRLRSVRDPDEVIIGFNFLIGEGKGIEEIVDYLKKYRKEDIATLTHELKHAFVDVKEKGGTLPRRVSYVSVQQLREQFSFIRELVEFLFNSYFIHAIENVVRPTELAAEMRMNNVSKKEFLNFFLNNEMIKRLKEIQNFSYEEFKEKLKEPDNINRIKALLDAIDIEYEDKTDDELVGELLKIFLVNFVNAKNDIMNKFLTSNLMEKLFGLQGDKDKFFRKYVSRTTKYEYDYDSFFKNEERFFNRTATAMIKKLAKLYASLKD